MKQEANVLEPAIEGLAAQRNKLNQELEGLQNRLMALRDEVHEKEVQEEKLEEALKKMDGAIEALK